MAEFAESWFPVVFFDGQREIEIGTVGLHPGMGFNKFRALISHNIGISPGQISTSLVRRKRARSSPEIRRRVPIDESSDFSAIARERDCFILVVLKRPRRERRGRAAAAAAIEPKTILKRNSGLVSPPLGAVGPWDFESQMRNLQREREMFLLSMAQSYPPQPSSVYFAPQPTAHPAAPPPVCEECLFAEEEGRSPPFHLCVYDAVMTEVLRPPLGPIQRPPKKAVDAFDG